MRGDISSMLLFLLFLFVGLWQIAVACLRLHGLSLTGSPDRKLPGILLGGIIILLSGAWYFSAEGHFASPDVEGFESLLLVGVAMLLSTIVQLALSSAAQAFYRNSRRFQRNAPVDKCEPVEIALDGKPVVGRYLQGDGDDAGFAIILLHDYGGCAEGLAPVQSAVSAAGHPSLSADLDGHGGNHRRVDDPAMTALCSGMIDLVNSLSGTEKALAIGYGYGGLLAARLATDGMVPAAISVDPPVSDRNGAPAINCFRELPFPRVARALLSRVKRGEGMPSLSALMKALDERSVPAPNVTVIGTRERWLNDPEEMKEFCGRKLYGELTLIDLSHEQLLYDNAAIRLVLDSIERFSQAG